MNSYYIEKIGENETCNIVDYNLHRGKIYNRKDKFYYVKIGSGFDIETSSIINDDYNFSYCYHWQFSLNDCVIMGRSLDTMLKLFEIIIDTLEKIDAYLLVLDANLGYEFQFCKKYWEKLGMSKLFAKEKRKPLKFMIGERIEMREVIGLFGYSLENIANNYTYTKKLRGDLDYSIIRTSSTIMSKQEIQYCINDVLILSELGNYIFSHYFGKNQSLPLTSTGIIRNKIKKILGTGLKNEKRRVQGNLPNEQDFNLHRNFLFKGGICGTNIYYMNTILKNVKSADLTSDYPAQMNHKLFPDGKCVICDNSEFMSDRKIPYIAMIEFLDIRSRTVHSLFSTHKCLNKNELNNANSTIDNGRIFRADRIVVVLNDMEFAGFCRAYRFSGKSKILKTWKFEKYRTLPEWVLTVLNNEYMKKNELKSSGKSETMEYRESKKIVNGTFGMMCTGIFNDDFIFNGSEIESPVDENGNVVMKSYQDAIKSMFLFPYWGYWITTYARNILIDVITRFPECIVQYDTDSIYYDSAHERANELEKYIVNYNLKIEKMNDKLFDGNEHFKTLGTWDFDEPYTRFKGLGSKRYMYEKQNGKIKCVVSGCRKIVTDGIEKSTIELQNNFNNDGMDIFDFFDDGMYIDENHSHKMASIYNDDGATFNYNGELLDSPSYLTLVPVPFRMGLNDAHIKFYITMQRMYNNCPGKCELKKTMNELFEVMNNENEIHR